MNHTIDERTALIMLEGVIPKSIEPDPHYTRRYNHCMESFAEASLDLYRKGKLSKFKEYLGVSLKLLRKGNDSVKNGVINIYYFALTLALNKSNGNEIVEKILSNDVRSSDLLHLRSIQAQNNLNA